MDKDLIISLIDDFVSGNDTSINQANTIGIKISKAFPEDEYMEDMEIFLASYRPEGGDFLYNIDQVKEKLIELKEKLLIQ